MDRKCSNNSQIHSIRDEQRGKKNTFAPNKKIGRDKKRERKKESYRESVRERGEGERKREIDRERALKRKREN